MRTGYICIAAFTFWGFSASSQSEYIVRQRARNVANQNNASQAGTPPAAQQQAPEPPPPPNPALTATLQNIANLEADLVGIEKDSVKKLDLTKDLTAAAQGTSPSTNSVNALAADLTTALAGKKLTAEQNRRTAQLLHASFNGAHLTPAQQKMVLDGIPKILLNGGVAADAVAKVGDDLKAIVSETK